MRYYLDTNILAFLILGNDDDLSVDTIALLNDYSNQLLTSGVCIHELIHLCQIGKLGDKHHFAKSIDIVEMIKSAGIEIVSVCERHLQEFAMLPMCENHRDPNDRLIIAQAMSDKISLVSSDRKFEQYTKYGLDFIFNRR